jgi:hypothetical protein
VKIKMSVSLAPDLRDEVRDAARRSGKTMSQWIAETIEGRLLDEKNSAEAAQRRHEGLGRFLEEWQAEHGAFTDEEMAEASREMGLPWPIEEEDA